MIPKLSTEYNRNREEFRVLPRIIHGNILDQKEGVIVHQVNNRHVMGAGLALQIRNKYPKHYEDYMNSRLLLGDIVTTRINSGLYVVGLIAQNGYGRNKCYTDYDAFKVSVCLLAEKFRGWNIYIPFGIGCGLAGGDWGIVSGILRKYIPEATLVKKGEG